MSELDQLRAELRSLRAQVAGKTFAEHPECFKDIEGVKVRIAKIAPPPARPAPKRKSRHLRRGGRHGK